MSKVEENWQHKLFSNPVVKRLLPVSQSLTTYNKSDFSGDFTAGSIVAVMLIPQAMAYALLAGMPAQTGLYASILPLIAYALFGTSRVLAVGPVAIISLMVASALAPFAIASTPEYVAYAVLLALMSGVLLIVLGLLRIGFIVNYLSHPVIAGFISAAALIIGFSQFKHLLGISIERTHLIPMILWQAVEKFAGINLATVLIAIAAISILAGRSVICRFLRKRGWVSASIAEYLPKAMPLVVVIISTAVSWYFDLAARFGIKIVGAVPAGLPDFQMPTFSSDMVVDLLPAAGLISIVGFLESVSVAKSLAAKRRQKIVPNQELIGLGMANLGAAFTGAYPVTGGFSRSIVNFNTGAKTSISAIFTAVLIGVVLIFFTPLLHHLPKAVLASIIIVAIASLIDFASFRHAWDYNRTDGASFLVTFIAVLVLGVEIGIVTGIVISLVLYLWRTGKPHIAIVGRVADSEHFRNVERHDVETFDSLLLLRIDESLYFANMGFLEDAILGYVADHERVENLVLIASAINEIDASALDSLEMLVTRLKDSGVNFHLAEVKGPVMDKLCSVGFDKHLLPGKIFLSTHDAVVELVENAKAND